MGPIPGVKFGPKVRHLGMQAPLSYSWEEVLETETSGADWTLFR